MNEKESRAAAQERLRAKYRTANGGSELSPQQAWDEHHAEELAAEEGNESEKD